MNQPRQDRRAAERAGRILAIAFLVFLAPACARRQADPDKAAGASAILVNAADVVRADSRRLESGTSFTGEIAPVAVVEVVAHFDGDLDNVLVREGQKVRRGEALARYRPVDVQDALDTAGAQLMAAKANLAAADNNQRRAERLLDAGALAPSDLEAAKSNRAAAEAQVDAAVAAANHAKDNVVKLDVPAPISGGVSAVFVHRGSRTAVGDRLFTLVDTDTVELSATIPSEALGRVRIGSLIRARLEAFPDLLIEGQVDRINPTTEPGTRQVRIYTRIPNPSGRLVGGLYASGRVIDQVHEQALAAPVSALRKEGTEQVVYRLKNGRAVRTPIEPGLIDEEAAVVELKGQLSPGDSLLSGVVPGLKDGVPVRVIAGRPAGAQP